jgi:transposase
MPKPYSSDLRQRAIALVEAGHSRRAVARLLNIGKATVILWVRDYRATGKQAAKPMGGRRRFALLAERDWLLARIAAAPDLTGQALRIELAERGTKVSYDAVWRFLREERLTFKNVWPAPSARGFCERSDRSASTYPVSGCLAPAKMEVRAPRSS